MTPTKIGRGFHRLAFFLAAIPLLLGGALSVYIAFDLANRLWEQHQKLVCAHEHLAGQKPGGNVFDQFDTVQLKQIGCSNLGLGGKCRLIRRCGCKSTGQPCSTGDLIPIAGFFRAGTDASFERSVLRFAVGGLSISRQPVRNFLIHRRISSTAPAAGAHCSCKLASRP
jgi:hypothetical protein